MLDYHDQMAYDQLLEQYIRDQMEEQRQESINFIGTLVRQDLANDFAKILAAAYEYGCPEAEKIAGMFGFNQKDFLAIDENYKEFKKRIEEQNYDFNEREYQ